MIEQRLGVGIYPFTLAFGTGAALYPNTVRILKNNGIKNLEPLLELQAETGAFDLAQVKSVATFWKDTLANTAINVTSIYANISLTSDFVASNQEVFAEAFEYVKQVLPNFQILVFNAVPLDWNDPSAQKTPEQLSNQIAETRLLAQILQKMGIELSYHFHTPELYANAREFDAMLNGLTADEMGLNLDANWAIQSDYPIDKIFDEHATRINSVHIRSSTQKVWDEVLGEGDEQNTRILTMLDKYQYKGTYLVELATEPNRKNTLSLDERIEKSMQWLRENRASN